MSCITSLRRWHKGCLNKKTGGHINCFLFLLDQKTNNLPLPNCVSERGEKGNSAKWQRDSSIEIESKYRSSKIIVKHPFGKFYIKATNVATRTIVKDPVNGYKIH